MTHEAFTSALLGAYGSTVALGFEFLLSSTDPDKLTNVVDELTAFTRIVFVRCCYPTITAAGTSGKNTSSHTTRFSVEDDNTSDDDDEDGDNKQQHKARGRATWSLPIRRRKSLTRMRSDHEVRARD